MDFDKWNTGTLIGPSERLFLSAIPAVNPVTVKLHKLDFDGKVRVVICRIPEKGAALFPEQVNWPAYNLKNLFELPVLFYALCLYLYVSQSVDPVFVWSGWAYVGLRAAHSLVHCTVNIVKLRFAAYLLSSLVLWFMVVRASWQFIDGMI